MHTWGIVSVGLEEVIPLGKKRNLRPRAAKSSAQRLHFRLNALERHGVELSRRDIAGIVKRIQRNKALFLVRESRRISIFSVRLRDGDKEEYPVSYDKRRQMVVTVLHWNRKWRQLAEEQRAIHKGALRP